MKKVAVFAGLFMALFVGIVATAQAGTHYSFGFSIGVGPTVPFGYYAYPPYYYSGYYSYPYNYYYYPSRSYSVPRYYAPRRYDSRYYRHDNGNRWIREGRSNSRSRSGRWR